MTSASLIDPKLMVFVCMSACILGGEGSSDYGKYLKVCFTFWNSESCWSSVETKNTTATSCTAVNQNVHIYYGDRERGRGICLNESRK